MFSKLIDSDPKNSEGLNYDALIERGNAKKRAKNNNDYEYLKMIRRVLDEVFPDR